MNHVLKTLPPSPVTSQITVDVRVGFVPGAANMAVSWANASGRRQEIHRGVAPAADGDPAVIRVSAADWVGENRITAEFFDADGRSLGQAETPLTVRESETRSSGLIDGAWCGFYHWSEKEGRLWNKELREFTAADWRELVRGMHELGMSVIVLQELFRNEAYFGKHDIPGEGYHGKAFYDSALYPGRMAIGCDDPVEAVFAAADELGMAVLPGIGMYAWFDYTAGSLDWHRRVAREVFERYGHHLSFYGWYISEEVFGELRYGDGTADTQENIVNFFKEFRQCRNRMAAAMPVMLAPNCFYINRTREGWERLARELDIICPFAFHRMEPDDLPAQEAVALFQRIADENGAHLWMDMEVFRFAEDMALYPRELDSLTEELRTFSGFEKILCYQYPGVFSAPEAARHPGGEPTVKLYRSYQDYYRSRVKG